MSGITIREELPHDALALHALTAEAFAPMPYSDGKEADALDQLRADGDLTVSLVAVDGPRVLGHIAFSPASVGDLSAWYGLGPISVAIDRQREGIGRRLIEQGLKQVRALGAHGVVLIGNPEVYAGSGFVSEGRLTYRDVPVAYVQHLRFQGPKPEGEILFSAGLEI